MAEEIFTHTACAHTMVTTNCDNPEMSPDFMINAVFDRYHMHDAQGYVRQMNILNSGPNYQYEVQLPTTTLCTVYQQSYDPSRTTNFSKAWTSFATTRFSTWPEVCSPILVSPLLNSSKPTRWFRMTGMSLMKPL
jgi:hypothetical protein